MMKIEGIENILPDFINIQDGVENVYLETGDKNIAKAFVELSRLKYGRDREFVSKEIEYRIGSV